MSDDEREELTPEPKRRVKRTKKLEGTKIDRFRFPYFAHEQFDEIWPDLPLGKFSRFATGGYQQGTRLDRVCSFETTSGRFASCL